MTRQKFDALTEAKKAKACNVASYDVLLTLAKREQEKYHDIFDIRTAMYRIHKQATAKPKKVKQSRPLYHPVTTNMLVRAMYDTYIPRDEKLC
ncbi:MAG: hypothetical protein GX638_18370 [Crenarchaeota archaeon]|nr:hypothetical protein [Thermoproteota archaeon]